jgi:uncharacterized protein YndB with AHSA1/START domain
MIDPARFKPKTVYVIYISSTPEKVWQALTDPALTRQYFFGFAIDIERKTGGAFRMLYPDGRVHVRGEVIDWSPPRRLAVTWLFENTTDFGELPGCLISYDIEPSGNAVKLTMQESHSWEVPDAVLAGGRMGWPKLLSALKTLVETGHPLVAQNEAPPPEFIDAVKRAIAEKPWLK